MTHHDPVPPEPAGALPAMPDAETLAALLLGELGDGLDHPDLWNDMAIFCQAVPRLPAVLAQWRAEGRGDRGQVTLLHALCLAAGGDVAAAQAQIAPLVLAHSQSALVQGVQFHLQRLADPANPKFALAGRICTTPFEQLDVLEGSAHQCCASWLQQSAGNLMTTPWRAVWNSPAAQAVRASVLDGTYRFCNKTACPKIQANALPRAEDLARSNPRWAEILKHAQTALPEGPRVVNLAYDRTCNLACPSCRTDRYAADDATRDRYARMQDAAILPMLKTADLVFITGSGDPFASKNFRRLMTDLDAGAYPDLRFQIMTNGMLFTPAQWRQFPALHGRVQVLKISTDAATGPTHEALRRGARWDVMLANMRFAGDLVAEGQIEQFDLVFTVQSANWREMGDAVDLAKAMGATGIYFARLTNWGTFTAADYADHAVFRPGHPDHAAFLAAMQDPRLTDPMVLLGDLEEFVTADRTAARKFLR